MSSGPFLKRKQAAVSFMLDAAFVPLIVLQTSTTSHANEPVIRLKSHNQGNRAGRDL